jgi:hypothetical protein
MAKLTKAIGLGLAIGALASASPAAADIIRVGTTALSKNDVNGEIGPQRRKLKIGDGIFQNELISTGSAAQAQMLFLDQTVLTIGPESRVVLDKAVFDPQKRTGEVSLRAVSGAFRFVSGSSPSDKYTIKTPQGTIGVRGTIIEWSIRNNLLTLILHQGAATYCAQATTCTTLNQPGTFITSDGVRYSRPQRLSSVGCGTGSCSEVDPSRPSVGSLTNMAPGAGPPPSPVVTPDFRNLRQRYHGGR